MDPKKTTPVTNPGTKKKINPSQNEEMVSPHQIEEEADLGSESEDDVYKQSGVENNSPTQDNEINETLGLDDDDLETKEEDVVN